MQTQTVPDRDANAMSAALARTRAVLSDPMSAPSDKMFIIGFLAIALIGTNSDDEVAEEARATIVAFWREMEAGR